MGDLNALQEDFFASLDGPAVPEALFDQIEDTVFFMKDRLGRYMSVNQTLVTRCGFRAKKDLIGRLADEVLPDPIGPAIAAQDRRVLSEGVSIRAKLERHLYANRQEGWCLTWKEPQRDLSGRTIGLTGISRDLRRPGELDGDLAKVSQVLRFIDDNHARPLRLPQLAKQAGLSGYQLDRRVRALLGLTVGQYIIRARIDHACERLRRGDQAIAEIALACGYGDQAAFSRQFRQSVGLSPAAYRRSVPRG